MGPVRAPELHPGVVETRRGPSSILRFSIPTVVLLWCGILCGALVCGVRSAHAAPKGARTISRAESLLDQARASYARVRAQDPEVNDLVLWDRTAARFSTVLESEPSRDVTADVYSTLADLYARMFERRGFQPALAKAIYFSERLAKEFQGDDRVPEKLLRLGDLRRSGLRDEAAARSAYYELIDLYPRSREASVARTRLGEKESEGDSPLPAAAKTDEQTTTAAAEAPAGGKEIYKAEEPVPVHRPTVVIDPGHGGEELGAIGVGGVLEKDVTLSIAQLVEELLRERLRARTILTRREDKTLSLADRTAIANDHQADLFISIHANASEYKTARGVEVYYLDNTNDKSSLKLAERENASLMKSGNDLAFIFSDFIQNAKLDESISLSHQIQNHLVGTLGRYYHDVKDLGVKKAPFYVLVGAHMPCVLTEVSFIDHPVEGARLATKRYQRLVALGIYQGVTAFFEQLRR